MKVDGLAPQFLHSETAAREHGSTVKEWYRAPHPGQPRIAAAVIGCEQAQHATAVSAADS